MLRRYQLISTGRQYRGSEEGNQRAGQWYTESEVLPFEAQNRRAIAAFCGAGVKGGAHDPRSVIARRWRGLRLLPPAAHLQYACSKASLSAALLARRLPTARAAQRRAGARVLELGKDAKNLYYIKDPAEVAFVAPSLQGGEGPIREAAAKLSIPKFSVQIGPLDGMQLRAGGYDAVLCVDMLRGAPRADARKVVAVMARCVAPGGRVVFAERPEVGMAALLAEAGLQPQQEEDGGFMVGVADKPDDAPDEARGSVVIGRESRASRRAKSKRAKKGG